MSVDLFDLVQLSELVFTQVEVGELGEEGEGRKDGFYFVVSH